MKPEDVSKAMTLLETRESLIRKDDELHNAGQQGWISVSFDTSAGNRCLGIPKAVLSNLIWEQVVEIDNKLRELGVDLDSEKADAA